ncbi:MAG: AAA family ATPase [Myxococcaceae bacterium]|nr:AAA family ATPase [Myxococcaceae bacterium]
MPAPAERPRFLRDLDTLIRARYPLLYLVSWEEQRVDALLAELARTHGKDLLEWTATRGLRALTGTLKTPPEETVEPARAVVAIAKLTTPALVVLKDFHRHLDDPVTVRALRELGFHLKTQFTTAIVVAPSLKLPDELEKDVSVIDVPLPSKADLLDLLKDIARVVTKNKRATVELNREQADALVSAAHGLTLAEAENAFAKAIAQDNRLDSSDVKLLLDEKSQVVRKNGLLEYYATDQSLADIGGLGSLKRWLDRRKDAFSEDARAFGLPEPKGVLLLGVQGCGKSLTARSIATSWRLPLVRLDMGRIYSGIIGSSEENLRRAIRVVESLAPVVLWVDEIEKGLAGAGGGANDSGVSARVFGTLLTWLQEKTAPVFVVATANRIDSMPPELLRKGRFDEIFFIDLPTKAERQEILSIQLSRRGRSPADFPLAALAQATEQFSGAELEQVVVSGMYEAFADRVQLEAKHLEAAVKETLPLAVTMAEDVDRLRQWAKHRTRSAS